MFNNVKNRDGIKAAFSNVPFGPKTVTTRVESLSQDMDQQVLRDLALCEYFSVQLDEPALCTGAVHGRGAQARCMGAVHGRGTPALCGVHLGFGALCRNDPAFPDFMSYHCVIHQQALVGKVLDFSRYVFGGQIDQLNSSQSSSTSHI